MSLMTWWFPGFFFLSFLAPFLYLGIFLSELAIHMISVEISRTRNEVRIPPLNVEPLAGKSGSKGVAAGT